MDDAVTLPYPGLRPFTKNESRIFFGRRRQCIQLLENLETQYFIAVTGQSGSGKSSLVKAGVIPLLERGSMPRDGRQWFTVETNPGEDPFGNLANALYKTFVTDHALFDLTTGDIQSVVETGPLGILALLEQRSCIRVKTAGDQGPRKNLLLLIDQFEEIFSYCEKHGFDTADCFISLLLETARQQKFAIFIILTMRSDFLGKCCFFEGLPEAVSKGQFLVPKLNQDDLRAAIIGPQRYFGFSVHPDLITKLLNDYAAMEADFQRTQDLLPLMQHVLMRLYHFAQPDHDGRRELTVDLYHSRKIQGLSKALNLHADDVYENLPTRDHKKVAQILFRRLTGKTAENSYVRSRAGISEIIRLCFQSRSKTFFKSMDEADIAQMVQKVADTFRNEDNCFLYPFLEKVKTLGAADEVNITHESLIRCWDKCRQWADMEAREADLFREIQIRGERAQQGEPYAVEKALERYEAWRKDAFHSAAWAQRYCKPSETCGQQFDLAVNFVRESRSRKIQKRIDKYVVVVAICWIVFALLIPPGATMISNIYREKGNTAVNDIHDSRDLINYQNAGIDDETARKAYAKALIVCDKALKDYEKALWWRNIYDEPDAKLAIIRSIGTIHSLKREHRHAIAFYQKKKLPLNHQYNDNSKQIQPSKINELILEEYRKYTMEILDSGTKNSDGTNDINKIDKIFEVIQELKDFQSIYETENSGTSEDDEPTKQGKACINFLLGLAHQEIKEREEAKGFYDQALKKQVQTETFEFLAQVYFNRGMLFIEDVNYNAAKEQFIIATSMQPGKEDYIMMAAANALYESKQFNEAVNYYKKIREDKNRPEKYGIYAGKCIGMAFCYKHMGNSEKAEIYLQRFREYARESGEKNTGKRINQKVKEFNEI